MSSFMIGDSVENWNRHVDVKCGGLLGGGQKSALAAGEDRLRSFNALP